MAGNEVVLQRDLLSPLLSAEVPRSCSLLPLTSQRIELWRELQKEADIYNDITETLFEEQFGTDFEEQRKRTLLLFEDESLIGAVTAWYGGHGYDDSVGRLHWLAVSPKVQGKGYGKLLVSLCLNRLQELGHTKVYLTTSSLRPIAIALYEKFGFEVV